MAKNMHRKVKIDYSLLCKFLDAIIYSHGYYREYGGDFGEEDYIEKYTWDKTLVRKAKNIKYNS